MGQTRISQCKVRINLYGFLERFYGTLQIVLTFIVHIKPAPEKMVICFRIGRLVFGHFRPILPQKFQTQGIDDGHGDFILNGKDIVHISIESSGPEMKAGVYID